MKSSATVGVTQKSTAGISSATIAVLIRLGAIHGCRSGSASWGSIGICAIGVPPCAHATLQEEVVVATVVAKTVTDLVAQVLMQMQVMPRWQLEVFMPRVHVLLVLLYFAGGSESNF